MRQCTVEIILPSFTRRPTQEKLRRARCSFIYFPVSEDVRDGNLLIAAHDERSHSPQHEVGRPALLIIVIECDCDTPAIDVPIARVPTNFRIRQKPLSVPIISDRKSVV